MKSKEEILDDKIQEQNGRYTSSVLPTNSTVESFKIRFADDEKEFIHSVMEYYADQVKPKWIDVSDRLPEEDGEYLTLSKQFNNSQQVVRFHRGCWSMWNQETTHWMPLPEPPKH